MNFNFIFYVAVCLAFLVLYLRRGSQASSAGVLLCALLTVIWLWVVLAFRQPTGDFFRYMLGLKIISDMSFGQMLSTEGPKGFHVLNWLISRFSMDSAVFYTFIYVLCVVPLYFAFRERFRRFDASVLLMLYLLYPFSLNYFASGFKQGISSGFMVWALACLLDRQRPRWGMGLLLLTISFLFHNSFMLVILALLAWAVFYRKRSPVWAIATMLVCMVMAMANITEATVSALAPAGFVDNLGFADYFSGELYEDDFFNSLNYKSGFRLDFAVFTMTPLFLVYIFKRSAAVEQLIKVYALLVSAYFLLCFIPFSDRIAAMSWFIIPYFMYQYLQAEGLQRIRVRFVVLLSMTYPLLLLTYTKGYIS